MSAPNKFGPNRAKAQVVYPIGPDGGDYVADTNPRTGNWSRIKALNAVVIASLTSSNINGTLTAIPLSAGASIEGNITGFTLTSGAVIASP